MPPGMRPINRIDFPDVIAWMCLHDTRLFCDVRRELPTSRSSVVSKRFEISTSVTVCIPLQRSSSPIPVPAILHM